ncbi:sugar ABC transporter permease [Paenibacillus sp. BIHB 4019]|uniref:Sugar ABC transporter permease n=1 Tax=Paenibacillus sp. BIHB 4019 TaxID=1870819 RepID=A0A1B2DNR7_9BACL|nr:sugar ABC transporter permease [Paenibacillus sp. BIHB 4019]ANY69347.1 sugar ABC transporter permease [Paenibacillus sp. BIHB 4019]
MSLKSKLGVAYLFTLPSFLLTVVFAVYPIIWAMRYMFFDYKGFGKPVFAGLDNFTRLVHDHLYWEAVLNTFVYAGGKLLITIPLSLVLAVILNRAIRGRQILRAVFFLPTIFSASVMAVVFYVIFNSYNGSLNELLLSLHLISSPVEWLGTKYAMLTVIIIASWGAIGNYMLMFLAGLQGISNDLYESASLDGAGEVQKFRFITVPMLGPVMQMIIMLAITVSLKGYESIMVLTEGGPIGKTDVMYLYVYRLFFPVSTGSSVNQDFGYGSAVGFTTAVIVGIITGLYFFMSRKISKIY